MSALARAFGSDRLAERLAEIETRLRGRTITVGVVGQFKRGKTTLINGLLGLDLLPIGILPTTSVVTRARYGETVTAIVSFADGSERSVPVGELAAYVTEEENPRNRRGVEDAVIACPAPFLRPGLEIVDTPGIGSTLVHNTEVAERFLPWIDVALFVVSPEPPLTEAERTYLQAAHRHAVKLALVITKSDTVSREDLGRVRGYVLREVTAALGVAPPHVAVSALTEAERERARVEIGRLVQRVAIGQLDAIVHAAAGRRALTVVEEIRLSVGLRLAALRTPRENAERALAGLREGAGRLGRLRSDCRTLWDKAARDVADEVRRRAADGGPAVRDALYRSAANRLATARGHPAAHLGALSRDLMEVAQEELNGLRDALRAEGGRLAREGTQDLLRRLGEDVNGAVAEAADLLGAPRVEIVIPSELMESGGFYFKWADEGGFMPDVPPFWLALLPRGPATRAVLSRATRAAGEAVDRNAGRLGHAFATAAQEVMAAKWRETSDILAEVSAAIKAATAELERRAAEEDGEAEERLTGALRRLDGAEAVFSAAGRSVS